MIHGRNVFKTTSSILVLVLLAFNFSCGPSKSLPPLVLIDDYYTEEELSLLEDCDSILNKYNSDIFINELQSLKDPLFGSNILGAGVGFAFNSLLEPDEFSVGAGVDYGRRITKESPNDAIYIGPAVGYSYRSADEFSSSMYGVGAKGQYFRRITPGGEVDFTGFLTAGYIGGKIEDSGFEEDLSGWGASAGVGANFNLGNFKLGISIPIITYMDQTFQSGDFEFQQNGLQVGLNKDNMVMARAIFSF